MLRDIISPDPSYPQIGRYPCRSVAATCNSSIINLAVQSIRMRNAGITEASGVDGANDAIADAADAAEAMRIRLEQGFEVPMEPLKHAGLLKMFRDDIATDLMKHAGHMDNPMKPGHTILNPFDLALSIKESFGFRLKQEPPVISEAKIRALCKALNVTEAVVLAAQSAQFLSDQNYLRTHEEDILQIIDDLRAVDSEGFELDNAESVEIKLPTMTRLRLMSAALRGLAKGKVREVQGFMRGRPEAQGNCVLIDKMSHELHDRLQAYLVLPQTKNAMEEAAKRGAAPVEFIPRPEKQKPSEVEEAMAKHKGHVVKKDEAVVGTVA